MLGSRPHFVDQPPPFLEYLGGMRLWLDALLMPALGAAWAAWWLAELRRRPATTA